MAAAETVNALRVRATTRSPPHRACPDRAAAATATVPAVPVPQPVQADPVPVVRAPQPVPVDPVPRQVPVDPVPAPRAPAVPVPLPA